MNIEILCRTCLKENAEMKSIFSKESEELLSNMIAACSVTKVSEDDGFPSHMCIPCIESVKISYDFKRKCESAYETLRNHLETQLAFDKSFKDAAAKDTDSEDERPKQTFENFHLQILGPNEKFVQTEEICFYPCEMCDMKFMSEDVLRMHRAAHKDDGFKCRICKKIYSRLSHLRRHISITHPGVMANAMDDITCYVCNKLFTRMEHLKRHMHVHDTTKLPKLEKDSGAGAGDDDASKDSMNEILLPSELIQVASAVDCKSEDEEQAHEDDEDEKPLINIRNKTTDHSISDSGTNTFESIENPVEIVKTETISDDDNDGGGQYDDDDDNDADYEIINKVTSKIGRNYDNNDYDENSTSSDDDETYELKKSKRKSRRSGGSRRDKSKRSSTPLSAAAKKRRKKNAGSPKENRAVKERYPCEECKKVYVDPVKFEAHKLAHSQAVKIHQCEKCEKTFTRANHLKRHMVTHSDVKPFSCDICEKKFSRIDHLNIHMHHHSDVKPHVCDICEKGFTRAEHLRNHKASRHGDRPPSKKSEICEICQKGFTTPKYLAVHMRSHTDRVYACKFCDEKFGVKNDLNEHSKKHVHEKPFLCSECGLRFVRNDYLVIHMRRHKGEKPYKCKYCGKGFPRATDLTVHERYHTGEKTHLCTTCGKGFQRAYNLLVHMRVHTGERPYQCPHCVKSFAQGNDLKAHVRRHTGERYKCDLCGDGFIQGYHLTQHKRNVHGIDMKSHIRRVEKFIPIPKPGAAGASSSSSNVAGQSVVPDMQQLEQIEQLHRLQDEAKLRITKEQNLMVVDRHGGDDSHQSQIIHVTDNGNVKAIKMEPSIMHPCDTQISDSQSSHDVSILSTISSPRDQSSSHHSHMLDNSSSGHGVQQQQQQQSSSGSNDNMAPYNMSLNLIASAMNPKFKLPPTFQ